MNGRLLASCVLISLPAVAACVFGGYLWADKLPRLARQQRALAAREYRSVAEKLAADTASVPGAESLVREKGWRMAGRVARDIPWGHHPAADGRECVWIVPSGAAPAQVRAVRVESAETSNELAWLRFGIPSVLLALVAMTAFGVFSFVHHTKDRDDFLAATAHDLTTPLVGLRLTVGRDDDEARQLVERMLRLVTNLKDFLRLGRRPSPKSECVDIAAAFATAYAVFRADYQDLFDGEDVAVSGADGLPPVRADEMMTVQVLWNLLANDLKYAAPFGRVSVAFSAADGFVRAEFRDEGPGMTPRQRRHAFDRYYRAAPALTSGKGGFGIGLCTAREFVRAMGGDLTVGPNAPKGCVFTMRLPVWT